VNDSNSGFLSKPEDPENLALILSNLINTPQLEIDKLGVNGFNYILNNYDKHTIFKQWEKIINN